MGVPHRFGNRRMHIVLCVGIFVMQPVMPGPPERPLLQSAAAEPCQHKLERTTGPIRFVREVTMVAGRDAEHAREVKHREHDPIDQMHAGEEDTDTAGMQCKEWDRLQPRWPGNPMRK
jgi:hypothetical protein